MALRKLGAVCLCRNARNFGEDHITNAAASHTQAIETVGHELMHQFRIPAHPVDGVLESGTPLTCPQPSVSGNPPTRRGMPVQVKGVGDHKPGQVPTEQTIWSGVLPVDYPPHVSVTHQEIARPEVAVHQTLQHLLAIQACVQGKEILNIFGSDEVIAESARNVNCNTVDHPGQVRRPR